MAESPGVKTKPLNSTGAAPTSELTNQLVRKMYKIY